MVGALPVAACAPCRNTPIKGFDQLTPTPSILGVNEPQSLFEPAQPSADRPHRRSSAGPATSPVTSPSHPRLFPLAWELRPVAGHLRLPEIICVLSMTSLPNQRSSYTTKEVKVGASTRGAFGRVGSLGPIAEDHSETRGQSLGLGVERSSAI